jgi:hypothetical protein
VKLFFAGGEAWADLLLSMGVKNILFSYYYFRTALRGRDRSKAERLLLKLRAARKKGYSFMLDSGAFTYHEKMKSGHGHTLPPPRAFFEEYLQFCVEWADVFEIIAELDIDGTIMPNGQEITRNEIDEWTNEMFVKVGWHVMPTYHPGRGTGWLQDWLLDTSGPYVGFGSDQTQGANQIIAQAHRHGKWVHGFAQTRINTDLKYTNFDSVDSTTWLRADKYGGTCIFRNGKWIVLDNHHKHQRAIYRDWYESWGLDFAKIAKDDLQENRLATIIAWRELANSFESKHMFLTKGKKPYILERFLAGKPYEKHPLTLKKD